MLNDLNMDTAALSALQSLLHESSVKTDSDSLQKYSKDWTKNIPALAAAVVFPKTTQDVKNVVLWARKHKVPLIPSGGRTGLSGGALATQKEVVVSFEKMNQILDFNELDLSLTVEAGVVTERVQKEAADHGLYFPVDFASRGSSHIGGNIATNAGGIKVLRYGLFRNWVAGLEVVTGHGDVLALNKGLIKNATGYDLRQLFIGSEGTLGLITKATLTLARPPHELLVFLFAVPALDSVMKLYHAFKTETSLMAYEMFTDLALDHVVRHTGLSYPLETRSPYYVLVEVEQSGSDATDLALSLFEDSLDKGLVTDGLQAQSPQQAREFWRFREDISEATAFASPYKNDVSVRISCVPEFLKKMDALLKKEYPHFEVVWFGHIGDGNLHINILKPKTATTEEFVKACKEVDESLFTMIESFGGSISAEHGVGLTKKSFLHHSRSREEIEIMRGIKSVFDPDGILNPGKIFD